MYDNKRIASGIGVLFVLWAGVGFLILSAGLGVSIPLTATGGFTLTADYLGASNQSAVPTTTATGAAAFEFRVRETRADNLYVNKTLDADTVPGLSGQFRVSVFAGTAYISETRFKSNDIRATTAIVRGLLVDDRYAGGQSGPIREKFLLYSGPNPEAHRSTNDLLEIGTSTPGAVNASERAALQFPNGVTIDVSTLSAEQVRIRDGTEVRVLYDPQGDGTFGVGG